MAREEGADRNLGSPGTAALNARAEREGECNDKKPSRAIRESDGPIVTRGKAAAPNRAKGGKSNFLVEADSKGYFDNLRQEELLRMLGERIQDGALLGLIRKWLRAGILEEAGTVIHPLLGTPQGGIVSPVLANVYLQDVLDQWFELEVRKNTGGPCRLFRFADDFGACFEYRHEALAFEQALQERLAASGLEVAPETTKTIRFGRNGGPKNGRLDFLGFEIRWEASRKGQLIVKRRTSRKKLQASVRRFTEWIKENRPQKIRKLMQTVAAKYQGYWNC